MPVRKSAKRKPKTRRNSCIPCNPGLRRIRRRNPEKNMSDSEKINYIKIILSRINIWEDQVEDLSDALQDIQNIIDNKIKIAY